MNPKKITFPKFTLPKGDLIPIEFAEKIPFDVKRMYALNGNKAHKRGQHAHFIEEEVFWCVAGSVTLETESESGIQTFKMDKNDEGIYIPTLCWHEFYDFSPDCVLLAFSSTPYLPGEGNYLTDRSQFRAHLASL